MDFSAAANTSVNKYDKSFYSQWERKKALPSATLTFSTETRNTTVSKTSTGLLSASLRPVTSATKTKSRYDRNSKEVDEKDDNVRVLELKIASCKSAISSHRKREQELISENLRLMANIQADEKPGHESVKQMLRKYEKFRGGISFLSNSFTETLHKEKTLLRELDERLSRELSLVQREVDLIDARLKDNQSQLHVLNNYKDKEYPVKSIQIAELVAELNHEEYENSIELAELQGVISSELDKQSDSGFRAEMELKESALSDVLSKMHPSLRDMSKQNQVMESEIEYHQKTVSGLQDTILKLKAEVKDLLSHPKTNLRLQVFPELFKYETKCTPDMDIILDIPKPETMLI